MFGYTFAFGDVIDPQFVGNGFQRGICPRCRSGLGMLPWLPPQRLNLSKRVYPDFLWGAGFEILLSDRTIELCRKIGIRGIVRVDPPAEIIRVGRKRIEDVKPPPPEYHYIWYRYDGARLDDERSGAVRPDTTCPYCRPNITAIDRVVLVDGSWTALDIFEAYGLPGTILVTDRFRDMVTQNRLTGAGLLPAEEYSFDTARPPIIEGIDWESSV